MAASKKVSKKAPSFEDGLDRLEELVEALESGDLGLEEGVDHYKEGVELLAALQSQLAGAETRVDELTTQLLETLAELEEDDDDGDEN